MDFLHRAMDWVAELCVGNVDLSTTKDYIEIHTRKDPIYELHTGQPETPQVPEIASINNNDFEIADDSGNIANCTVRIR